MKQIVAMGLRSSRTTFLNHFSGTAYADRINMTPNNDINTFRKYSQIWEVLYYHITNGPEFSTLSRNHQEKIADGLRRVMCIPKAYSINEPSQIDAECKNYAPMYGNS